jgi:hypothetical protein
MKDRPSRRPPPDVLHTVRDPEQARILSDPKSRRYFDPFVARERTVSEAAEEANCGVHTMLYRVKTFVRAGLLRIVWEEKRAGRPIKHYRSVEDAYFIPFDVTPSSNLEERLLIQMEPRVHQLAREWAKLLREVGQDGRRLYRDDYGQLCSESGAESTAEIDFEQPPFALDFAPDLYLTDDEAKALRLELHDLYLRYLPKREKKPAKKYLFQAALLPLNSS